jgi:hypothetical protein
MVHADLAMRFNAPADRVWTVLTGPEMVPLLLESYAEKVEFESTGTRPVFVTTLRSGGVIRERLELVDQEERHLQYRVLDAGPLPYANYTGEGRVQPCGDKACVLSFQCRFIAVEVSEAEALDHWTEHNRHVMATLRKFVEG